MPCGGIYPNSDETKTNYPQRPCWFEDGDDSELFCEEWDTWLHVKCLIKFLSSEEGRCVMAHGHTIYIPIELWEAHG